MPQRSPTAGKPTPREAQRLIDFLNSRPRGAKPDGLAGIDSATRVLQQLGVGGFELDALGLERLRRLRDALTVLADRGRGDRGRSRAWDAVNDIAARVPVTLSFGGDDEASVRPSGEGADAAIGALIADLHVAVSAGRWPRVRLCAHEPCSHAFYDHTRSRTQRWHSYAVCGNRANVAAHRRRTAA